MGLIVEGIIDCAMDREEKPGRSLALEPLLLALSSADRQVRIFGPVIGRRTGRLVSIRKAKFLGRGTVGCELVRHDRLGAHVLMLQQLSQQPRGSSLVGPLLEEHVQNLALVIDGPPQERPLAADPYGHLIQMPPPSWLRPRSPNILGELKPELPCPGSDRFVADLDPGLRQQVLDVPKAERKPEIQPDGVADNDRRQEVMLARDRFHRRRLPCKVARQNPNPANTSASGLLRTTPVTLTTPAAELAMKRQQLVEVEMALAADSKVEVDGEVRAARLAVPRLA